MLSAYNGPTALELAETELPDIILLDVMMPRMDGFEVCRQLKANPRTADIPVVMVTALSDVADRLRGLEAGADDFLTKPVNDIALFARVRSLVRLKRMMEELRAARGDLRPVRRAATLPAPARTPARPASCSSKTTGFAAARMAETLAPVAAFGGARTELRRSAEAARRRHRADHRQPVDAGRRPAAARHAVPRQRGLPPTADPADRRRQAICRVSPRGSISAPTTIWSARSIATSCWRGRAPRSAASGCRTGCTRITAAACRWR